MRGVGTQAGLYLRLRGVVRVVSVVVLARHCGLYAGGVEEAAQLLLLALSQAVDDAARLLLLPGHTCGQCVICGETYWMYGTVCVCRACVCVPLQGD